MSEWTVIFRCDGNASVGLGHLSRCLALADAVDEVGGRVVFVGDYDEGARVLLQSGASQVIKLCSEPSTIDDAEETARLVGSLGAHAVVLDGYLFDASFLGRLGQERTRCPLAIIDDFGAVAEYPRLARIINFTLGADHVRYEGRDLRIRRGPGFTLLRRATRLLRKRPLSERGSSLLVAIGGVDRGGFTEAVVRAASASGEREVDVVMSEGAPGRDHVERLAHSFSYSIYGRQPDLAARFAAARACVTGGGLTKYEACFLGLPCAVIPQTSGEAEDTVRAVALGLVLAIESPSPDNLERALRALADPSLCADLRAACHRTFPSDPTRAALQFFLDRDFSWSG